MLSSISIRVQLSHIESGKCKVDDRNVTVLTFATKHETSFRLLRLLLLSSCAFASDFAALLVDVSVLRELKFHEFLFDIHQWNESAM